VQVTQDIGVSHVKEENVCILNITSIPCEANVLPPISWHSTLSPDEALLAMVKDEQTVSKSIYWKVSIMLQWNALTSKGILGFCEYSHEQLWRRYKYLQTQLSIPPFFIFDVARDISQDITKEVET